MAIGCWILWAIQHSISRTKTINWIEPNFVPANSWWELLYAIHSILISIEIQGWHYYLKLHLLFLNPQYAGSALKTKHWRNVRNWIRHKNFEFVTGVDFDYFALKSVIFSRTPFQTRLIWTIPDKFEQFQTSLDKSGQV